MLRNRKMKAIDVIVIAIVITIVGILFFAFFRIYGWESFYLHEDYKGFFETSIVEIELEDPTFNKVVFTDKTLIDTWVRFFNTLEIRQIPEDEVFFDCPNGGCYSVTVRTESDEFVFELPTYFLRDDSLTIYLKPDYYDLKADMEFIDVFNSTYEIAEDRHYVVPAY